MTLPGFCFWVLLRVLFFFFDIPNMSTRELVKGCFRSTISCPHPTKSLRFKYTCTMIFFVSNNLSGSCHLVFSRGTVFSSLHVQLPFWALYFIWRSILVRYQILKIKFGTRRYGTAFYKWSLWLLCQAKEIRSWVLKFALQYK